MIVYLLAFVHAFWPNLTRYQRHEVKLIVTEIATKTDGDALEDLFLVNTAALESNFDTHAVGKGGEKGAFQVSTDGGRNHDFSAREALRRIRVQGWVAYVGCRHAEDHVVVAGTPTTCAAMIEHRTEKAVLYRLAFDPPTPEAPDTALAGNP